MSKGLRSFRWFLVAAVVLALVVGILVFTSCDMPESIAAEPHPFEDDPADVIEFPEIRGVPPGFYAHGLTMVEAWALHYGPRADIPRMLGQVHQESRFNCRAVSPVGARGCPQFMPATERAYRRSYGIVGKITDPYTGAVFQAFYLREQARVRGPQFADNRSIWSAMFMSYNGAPRSFDREWNAAGRPRTIAFPVTWPCLRGRAAWCRENRNYAVGIERWADRYYRPLWEGRTA